MSIKNFKNIDVLTNSQKKKLPSGNFKYVPDPEKIGRELIEKYDPEDKTGYIMKVDLVSKNGFSVQNQMAQGNNLHKDSFRKTDFVLKICLKFALKL